MHGQQNIKKNVVQFSVQRFQIYEDVNMLLKYKYLRTKSTGTVLMQQFYSLNATNFVTRNYFAILLVT